MQTNTQALEMTPEQKLKHMILISIANYRKAPLPAVTAENIDALFDAAGEADEDAMQDMTNEVRYCGVKTGLPSPHSRHYEGDEVAAQAPDGSWVGWTYWHGGGKHGEPEAVEWMCFAYDLTCSEEVKTVTVQTFAKVPA